MEHAKPLKDDQATSTLILETAISMFAVKGYLGVSMRDLAKRVGITPAALYHHFPNKESLHIAAVMYAYKTKSASAVDTLKGRGNEEPPLARLEKFVTRLCKRFAEDPEFRLLVQRSIMDAETNEDVRQVLVDNLYRENYGVVEELMSEINPDADAHMLTVSVYGLVFHVYTTRHIRRYLPGYRPEHESYEAVARHVLNVLLYGMLPDSARGPRE